jgi:hypothetical protein
MVKPVEEMTLYDRALAEIKKLEKQVKKLRKRLIEKMKYEEGYLVATGTTPKMMESIRQKDEAALRDD